MEHPIINSEVLMSLCDFKVSLHIVLLDQRKCSVDQSYITNEIAHLNHDNYYRENSICNIIYGSLVTSMPKILVVNKYKDF